MQTYSGFEQNQEGCWRESYIENIQSVGIYIKHIKCLNKCTLKPMAELGSKVMTPYS